MEKFKEIMKSVARSGLALLSLTLLVMVLVKLVDGLYDLKVLLGVAAGAFGYELALKAWSTFKPLQ